MNDKRARKLERWLKRAQRKPKDAAQPRYVDERLVWVVEDNEIVIRVWTRDANASLIEPLEQ